MTAFFPLFFLAFLPLFGSICSASRAQSPLLSPASPPEMQSLAPFGPAPFPSLAPTSHGSSSRPRKKHHQRMPHAPTSAIPPLDCDGVMCSEPLTETPIGSPCGCVLPISVVIDLGVAPYLLFTRIAEFEVEIATGTFLKQSQVKIMAASPSLQDQGRTRVTVYLVPLGERFDYTTASLIYERLWQKKLPIDVSIFGDYEVIDVHYPGLPSSPPSSNVGPTHPRDPGSSQYPLTANVPPSKSRKLNTGIIIVISVSSFTLILACFGVIFFICKWSKLRKEATPVNPPIAHSTAKRAGIRTIMSNSVASSDSLSIMSTMAACIPPVKTFTMAELRKATNEFSTDRILGEGGFGVVYHGILDDGNDAAVKLLSKGDPNTDREFIAEVEMLSRLHHRNLVKLIGICIDGTQRCLVYELVRNGNVESHLHGIDKEKSPLDWDTRMKIAIGAARGLAYLHEDSNPRVIHRDFKASNVLLEDDFTPKVTDFGLAREASEGSNHISTRVMGTFGYVAPEYAMTGHLLVKSDVYSYGVVLLELLTGRKPVYISESQGPENLVTWARPLLTSKEGVEKLIDPSLHGNYDMNNVARAAAIASMCVHTEPCQRPFMGEVVQALKLIYNPKDESCDDSSSQKESSCGNGHDPGGDFCAESSWWRNSLGLPYGPGSPFMTMEYSSDTAYEIRVPHSASQLVERAEPITRHAGSGPLRTKTKRVAAFYRMRGCISEHGQRPRNRVLDEHFDPNL